MKTFNMNSTVRLKLNAKGLEIINSLDKYSRDSKVISLTDDGYCEMTLVDVLFTFGKSIYLNSFDMNIQIYEEDLT